MRWKGHSLHYRVFHKDQRVTYAAITENKRRGEVLAYIKEPQDRTPTPKAKSNSEKNGYTPRGRKQGWKKRDFTNDRAIIVKRQAALSRLDATE